MHEEFRDLAFLPELLYIPKGKEIQLLKELENKEPRSGKDYEILKRNYEDEIQRLEIYGLVEIERDENNKDYRIKITNRGLLFLSWIDERI